MPGKLLGVRVCGAFFGLSDRLLMDALRSIVASRAARCWCAQTAAPRSQTLG